MPCVVETRICNLRQGSRHRIQIPVTRVSDESREFENRAGKKESNRNVLYRIIIIGCVLESSIRFISGSTLRLLVEPSPTPLCLGAATSCDCLLCQYLRRQGVLEWRAGLTITKVDLEACADPLRRHGRCGSGRHQGEDCLPMGLGVLAIGTAALDDYRALWIEYEARPPDEGGNQEASEDISGLSTR